MKYEKIFDRPEEETLEEDEGDEDEDDYDDAKLFPVPKDGTLSSMVKDLEVDVTLCSKGLDFSEVDEWACWILIFSSDINGGFVVFSPCTRCMGPPQAGWGGCLCRLHINSRIILTVRVSAFPDLFGGEFIYSSLDVSLTLLRVAGGLVLHVTSSQEELARKESSGSGGGGGGGFSMLFVAVFGLLGVLIGYFIKKNIGAPLCTSTDIKFVL
ncbi:hypothetical protein TIFTF001_012371 [Ficus carica]|uniref:Uncharacterized protein n=1 Tax=Ficus carica TaxID=3494 RepID=A0AA88AN83_FICCA|nr:hypothetical protein TIFTF001_012371 [Ficus carica]